MNELIIGIYMTLVPNSTEDKPKQEQQPHLCGSLLLVQHLEPGKYKVLNKYMLNNEKGSV